MDDMVRKGRSGSPSWVGEDVPNAKLTDEAVKEIRRRYAARESSQFVLADKFGVHQSVISEVVNFRIWTHVQ